MNQKKFLRTEGFLSLYIVFSLCTVFLAVTFLSGCTLKRSGCAAQYFSITTPKGLIGLSKGEAVKRLGAPDETVKDKRGYEYLVFENERGFQIFAIGKKAEESLVLELKDDTVISATLAETGAGIGLTP